MRKAACSAGGDLVLSFRASRVSVVVGAAVVIGQRLHQEALPLLGAAGQHIPGPFLAAQAPTAADGAGGIDSDNGREVGGVPALLMEPQEPFPGQGAHLGQRLLQAMPAAQMAEVDLAMPVNEGQDGQEVLMQGVRSPVVTVAFIGDDLPGRGTVPGPGQERSGGKPNRPGHRGPSGVEGVSRTPSRK